MYRESLHACCSLGGELRQNRGELGGGQVGICDPQDREDIEHRVPVWGVQGRAWLLAASWCSPLVGEREARFRFRVVSSSVRFLLDTFPHAPRLEPCLRLSPHTAQHFRISLGLSSVTFGAEYLYVFHTVCILRVFEPRALFDVINLYFPSVEFFLAPCADRAVPENDFVSQVSPSWPAFSGVDVVIAEKAFSLDAFLFFFDFIFLGVGVMPGLSHMSFGCVLDWPHQRSCFFSEGFALAESLQYFLHVPYLVLA